MYKNISHIYRIYIYIRYIYSGKQAQSLPTAEISLQCVNIYIITTNNNRAIIDDIYYYLIKIIN